MPTLHHPDTSDNLTASVDRGLPSRFTDRWALGVDIVATGAGQQVQVLPQP